MSPRDPWKGAYSSAPANPSPLDVLRGPSFNEAVLRAVYTANLRGFLVDKSIPQRAVDTPLVDDLPVVARDGDEVYYEADDAAATHSVIWHLRYRQNVRSDFPWEFVGGNPLVARINTSEGTASTSYTDLATVGPQLQLPFAGDWMIQVGAGIFSDTAGQQGLMSVQTTLNAASDTFSARSDVSVVTAVSQPGTIFGQERDIALVSKYRSTSGAATATFFNRWLAMTPVRVGRSA